MCPRSWRNEGGGHTLNQTVGLFFPPGTLRELSPPAVESKCHFADSDNVEGLEASFSQSYSMFNPCQEDSGWVFFLIFSLKIQEF